MMTVATSRWTHRSIKKQQTHEKILANAIAFFRERGIRRTRLSEVAERSGVSAATLFNYYPNKGRLAEAWVRGEVERILDEAVAESRSRDRSLRSAIRAACREIAAAATPEPGLRYEAWQEAGRAADPSISNRAPLIAGLLEEQKRERVRSDVSAEDLGEMLIEAIEGGLITGLRDAEALPSIELEARLSQKIRERVDLVLDGARKRNERVRVPATRPAPNR